MKLKLGLHHHCSITSSFYNSTALSPCMQGKGCVSRKIYCTMQLYRIVSFIGENILAPKSTNWLHQSNQTVQTRHETCTVTMGWPGSGINPGSTAEWTVDWPTNRTSHWFPCPDFNNTTHALSPPVWRFGWLENVEVSSCKPTALQCCQWVACLSTYYLYYAQNLWPLHLLLYFPFTACNYWQAYSLRSDRPVGETKHRHFCSTFNSVLSRESQNVTEQVWKHTGRLISTDVVILFSSLAGVTHARLLLSWCCHLVE